MRTLVVGFRLGKDATSRQVTVLVTESGVMHRAHGPYGKLARLSAPEASLALTTPGRRFEGEQPLARPIAKLREHHATYTKKGYTRALIPPAVVRLAVEEHSHLSKTPHRELIQAFIGEAPTTPQPLEAAIKDFRNALGLPARPSNIFWAPRERAVPPRVEAMLRTLAHGSPVTAPQRLPIGWTVSGEGVRLHVGTSGEALDRRAVIELQAALTAWLRFTANNSNPAP